eukprot:scaffold34621_cov166-Amphora_coffeaeformis.AAC.20
MAIVLMARLVFELILLQKHKTAAISWLYLFWMTNVACGLQQFISLALRSSFNSTRLVAASRSVAPGSHSSVLAGVLRVSTA